MTEWRVKRSMCRKENSGNLQYTLLQPGRLWYDKDIMEETYPGVLIEGDRVKVDKEDSNITFIFFWIKVKNVLF